jgi:hypothetical protein
LVGLVLVEIENVVDVWMSETETEVELIGQAVEVAFLVKLTAF